jgi:hypothetical protein
MKTAREFAMEIIDRHFTDASRDLVECTELIEAREKELKAPGLLECGHPKLCWQVVRTPFPEPSFGGYEFVAKCVWCAETAKLQAQLKETHDNWRIGVDAQLKLQAQVYALESQIAEVCPEDTDIREHVRLLQSLIEGHRAKISQLQAEIAELRAGAAAVMESAVVVVKKWKFMACSDADGLANEIRALIPADSAAALDQVKDVTRLETLKEVYEWWDGGEAHPKDVLSRLVGKIQEYGDPEA